MTKWPPHHTHTHTTGRGVARGCIRVWRVGVSRDTARCAFDRPSGMHTDDDEHETEAEDEHEAEPEDEAEHAQKVRATSRVTCCWSWPQLLPMMRFMVQRHNDVAPHSARLSLK